MNWQPIATMPRGSVALTKVHDSNGERNVQKLRRDATSNLFWTPDGSMYVYYTPTHWCAP